MIDKQSDTWLILEKLIDTEIAATSRKLISKHTDLNETMFYRGVYAALVMMKESPNKSDIPVIESENYFN